MGQYRHPTGIFYGGAQPVWSQRTLEAVAKSTLAGAQRTGILDLHTGLGPFGVGELIASHPDDAGRTRLDDWYGGDYTLPSEGTSVSADVSGDVLDALDDWVECPEITSVAIEWGTVDIVAVSNALRGRRVAARERRSSRAGGRADQGGAPRRVRARRPAVGRPRVGALHPGLGRGRRGPARLTRVGT